MNRKEIEERMWGKIRSICTEKRAYFGTIITILMEEYLRDFRSRTAGWKNVYSSSNFLGMNHRSGGP